MGDVVTDPGKWKRGWRGGLPETPCGRGSTLAATEAQRQWIPDVIRRYGIRSVVDVGAGDLHWSRLIDWTGISYTALDLLPRHPSVRRFDLVTEIPPRADLLMVLWVLNHLPFNDCRQAIANLLTSGSRWLMMTDRLRYRPDQPPEIVMPAIEELALNAKGDSIRLIPLC